jgi:hypothetical protein
MPKERFPRGVFSAKNFSAARCQLMFRSPIAAAFALAKNRNAAACDSACPMHAASSPLLCRNTGSCILSASTEESFTRKLNVYALMLPCLPPFGRMGLS